MKRRWLNSPEGLEPRAMLAVDTSQSVSAFLSVYVDHQKVTIPANVGVNANDTTASTFTTDATGKIFFANNATVTLGDFFNTWRVNAGLAGNNSNAIFSSQQIMSSTVSTTKSLQLFVNGQLSTSYQNQQLHSGDHVVIAYGADTVVALNTNFGSIIFDLYNSQKPITVANFLTYLNRGDYTNSFFHRSSTNFVIQGGGFKTSSTTFTATSQFTEIDTDPAIQNEPGISNLRGTIAMAKLGGDPNSATSQFFVNLNNSNSSLDSAANNAFTVFGQVLDMSTVDTIAALPIDKTHASPYNELPLSSTNQLAVIQSVVGQGKLSGFRFDDVNGNGTIDTGEQVISGSTVYLDANNNGSFDSGEVSTTTDTNGHYQFFVSPGQYVLRSVLGTLHPSTVGNASTGIGGNVANINLGSTTNNLPVADADAYNATEDSALTVTAANGVLKNDSDGDQQTLTAVIATQPAHGTVTLNSDGSFTYTPTANYFGTDSFTYKASDGTAQSVAGTVTLTVAGIADPPTAVTDSFTVNKNNDATSLNVLLNDNSNPDGTQTLSITNVSTGSAGGTITQNGSSISYKPATGFTGIETFSYTIKDTDNLSAATTVSVTVVDPTANGSISARVFIDLNDNHGVDTGEVGMPGVQITLSGTTTSGTQVSKTLLTDNNGTVTFGSLLAGTYKLTEQQPAATTDGTDTTTVSGATAGSDEITNIVLTAGGALTGNLFAEKIVLAPYVNITWFFVSAGNSIPTLFREAVARAEAAAGHTDLAASIRGNSGQTTVPTSNVAPVPFADQYQTNPDTTLTVTAANGVLKNDTDANNDALTASVLTTTAHGTLTLQSNGSFTYVPTVGFAGNDSFTYEVSDGTSTVTGTATINVNVLNHAPVAANNSYTAIKNNPLVVPTNLGVLQNDSDPDNDTLTAVVGANPQHGTLALQSDGSFTYTPTSEFLGTDTFTYVVSDGTESATGTVTMTVIASNNPVQANADNYNVTEDQVLTVNVADGLLKNDSDPDSDTMNVIVTPVTAPNHGQLTLNANGSFTYTPLQNYFLGDSFTYSVTDGKQLAPSTATVTITMTGVNDAPFGLPDTYGATSNTLLTISAVDGVLKNDGDVEGNPLTVAVVATTSHGTLNLSADGSFTFNPTEGYHGSDSFTYKVNDGSLDSSTVTVTINVNAAPQAISDNYNTLQGQDLVASALVGLLTNDTDADGDTLVPSIVSQPTHGTISLQNDGSFTYTPESGFVGTDHFTYKVNDGKIDSAVGDVNITVNPLTQNSLTLLTDEALGSEEDWLA